MPERDDPLWHFVHNRLPGPPSARFLGWRCVELDVARGTIAVEFAPKPECLNPAGGIAGGFIAHMLDATMGPGVAITLAPGQFPTTVEFKVCFLRPVRLGTVIGRARIVHRGEARVFAEGELRGVSMDDLRRGICASIACRAAIKINTRLDGTKMEWMLRALAQTDSPMSCPHGRPIAMHYSTREILKAFHRI